MLDKITSEFVGLGTAIIGLALIAVILSKKADTAGVLKSLGDALSADIGAAVKPVTG
jgi:hypothetical protein